MVYLIAQLQKAKDALIIGWLFGFGCFASGVYWVYHSLNIYGEANSLIALLLTTIFVAFLAVFYCLFVWIAWLLKQKLQSLYWFFYLALFWGGFEWFRSWLFSGFPWLLSATSQVDGFLNGWFALVGVYGTGALVMLFSASIVAFVQVKQRKEKIIIAAVLFLLSGFSFWLKNHLWVEPLPRPIKVALVQGNIEQSLKFKPGVLQKSLQQYMEMSLKHLDSDVIIWPETAISTFSDRIDGWFSRWQKWFSESHTQLLSGIFRRENVKSEIYYNSLVDLTNPAQYYDKRHLVPFGEYIPFRSLLAFVAQYMQIPMSDLQPGKARQPLMPIAGYKAGISICFEDAYSSLFSYPQASPNLFVNISNDAWFGNTSAPWQHLQIARVRSLEYQKPMLRITNNGVSAIINRDGKVLRQSRQFIKQVLVGEITPVKGQTPYERWQNLPLMLLFAVAGMVLVLQLRKSR